MTTRNWNFKDPELNRAFREIKRDIDSNTAGVLSGAKFLTDSEGDTRIAFTAATNQTFKHGLGREYKGFLVAYRNGPYDPYVANAASDDASQVITLVTTNNVTLSILIF